MSTVWRPTGWHERPHPLTPLVRGWVLLAAAAIALAKELFPGQDESPPWQALLIGAGIVVLLGAVSSFVSWRFTKFVIDDTEVRIETGWLNTSSKKVPFERVQSIDITQPFVARLFGLAELTIQAGAGDSDLHLRYLTRRRANELRDHLLARSTGDTGPVASRNENRLTGVSEDDEVLVRISARSLILGFVTSSDFLMTVLVGAVIAVVIGVASWGRGPAAFIAGPAVLLPIAFSIVNMAIKYVVRQMNYTMVRSSESGVRVTAGLTSLNSRTIPIDRVQGFRIHQGLLWQALGLYRIDVDIIGSTSKSKATTHGANLLPIGTRHDVDVILSTLLPHADLTPHLLRTPSRSRWLRPFDFWTLRHGLTADVVVTHQGWWRRVEEIVPHAKTQSVKIRRGPIQKMLGLATVCVHNVDGPVDVVVRHIDTERARELAFTQLDRSRVARGAARPLG